MVEPLVQVSDTGKPDAIERDGLGPEERGPVQQIRVAVAGVALCKVDAGYGAIHPGDLLTVSPTAGHAMFGHDLLPGTILGKALEPLDSGTGLIKVLVMLR